MTKNAIEKLNKLKAHLKDNPGTSFEQGLKHMGVKKLTFYRWCSQARSEGHTVITKEFTGATKGRKKLGSHLTAKKTVGVARRAAPEPTLGEPIALGEEPATNKLIMFVGTIDQFRSMLGGL